MWYVRVHLAAIDVSQNFSISSVVTMPITTTPTWFCYQIPIHYTLPVSLSLSLSLTLSLSYSLSLSLSLSTCLSLSLSVSLTLTLTLSQVWDIMRAFCKIHVPINLSSKSPTDPAIAILAKTSKTGVDFTVPQILKGPKKRAARFAPNPGPHVFWHGLVFYPPRSSHLIEFVHPDLSTQTIIEWFKVSFCCAITPHFRLLTSFSFFIIVQSSSSIRPIFHSISISISFFAASISVMPSLTFGIDIFYFLPPYLFYLFVHRINLLL